MQEPSASAAVTVLDPKPGMFVADLCAAPGSKSTQILEMLKNQGMYGLKLADINVNRKMLSEIAIHDEKAFKDLVDASKKQLAAK